nr:hypothetical protein BaRGS_021813 [Batillaria attramentaria]
MTQSFSNQPLTDFSSALNVSAIIAVERCVCVFLPMKAASLMKTRTMAVIILVTVGTLQVACLNYLFKMDIYLATDQQTNRFGGWRSGGSLRPQKPATRNRRR